MDVFQLVGIGITGAVTSVVLKKYRPEMAICTALATGVILLAYILGILENIISILERLVEASGLEKKYFSVILKIIGISYITEIAAELCKDAGQGAIATKLELVGKVFILMLSMPIISGFLEVCTNAVNVL